MLQSMDFKRVRHDPVMRQQQHSSYFWISENLESLVMLMGFSRQEYWSGLLYPPPGNLPNPGMKGFFTTSATWEVHGYAHSHVYILHITPTRLYHNYIMSTCECLGEEDVFIFASLVP